MAAIWTSTCGSMDELFLRQLRHRYDAELRTIEALPRLIAQAHSDRFKQACVELLERADRQVKRLEAILERLALKPRREHDGVIGGILEQARELWRDGGDPTVRDAALIAVLQTIAHVGIAGYGTARTWALHLGLGEAAEDLEEALRDERAGDLSLTELAESGINAVATYSSHESEAGLE